MEPESVVVKLIKADHHLLSRKQICSRSDRVWSKTKGGLTGLLSQLSNESRTSSLLTWKCPSMWLRLMADELALLLSTSFSFLSSLLFWRKTQDPGQPT